MFNVSSPSRVGEGVRIRQASVARSVLLQVRRSLACCLSSIFRVSAHFGNFQMWVFACLFEKCLLVKRHSGRPALLTLNYKTTFLQVRALHH